MWCHLENIALIWLISLFNICNLLADLDQCIAESIKFFLALALCWFNHKCICNWPAHCWCMEPIVLQSFGDINGLNVSSFFKSTNIQNELVRTATLVIGINDGIMWLETGHYVVCVEKGDFGCMSESQAAHHLNVRPTNGQN